MAAVSVYCRVRPRVGKDEATVPDCMETDDLSVRARDPSATVYRSGTASFTFDRTFGTASSQQEVFDVAAAPLVKAALDGFNGTIFAYGQTGSGKTFTMTGADDNPGVIPRVCFALFKAIEESPATLEFTIRTSYLEIYCERVRDLLHPETLASANLSIRQDPVRGGVYVEGATAVYVASADELLEIVATGDANRAVGSTLMNADSSRSHAILVLELEQRDTREGSVQTSKLSLVDLAGSESVGRTHAEGLTLDEAKMINKSLFALSKCVSALADANEAGSSSGGTAHVPYRDSKLTRLLQDSLGGNARTSLVVCCSPVASNLSESLSTLRFGQRAKKIKNRPVVNRVRTAEELEKLLAKASVALDTQAKFIEGLQRDLSAEQKRSARLRRRLKGLRAAAAAAGLAGALTGAEGDDGDGEDDTDEADLDAESEEEDGGDEEEEEEARPRVPRSGVVAAVLGEGAAPASGDAPASGAQGGASDGAPASRGAAAALASAAPSTSLALLVQAAALREELARTRARAAADAEELRSKDEEIAALTAMVASREAALSRATAEHSTEVAATRAEAAAAAIAAAVSRLRAWFCDTCRRAPFSGLQDVEGVTVLHSHSCFEASTAQAAAKAAEARASVLAQELAVTKDYLALVHAGKVAPGPPGSEGSVSSVSTTTTSAASSSSSTRSSGCCGKSVPVVRVPDEATVERLGPAPAATLALAAAAAQGSDAVTRHAAVVVGATAGVAGAHTPLSPLAAAAAAVETEGLVDPVGRPILVSVAHREVVDADVARDLRGRLAALVQVHRQLLRKYAVLDAECSDLRTGIKVRDEKIAAVVAEALAPRATPVAAAGLPAGFATPGRGEGTPAQGQSPSAAPSALASPTSSVTGVRGMARLHAAAAMAYLQAQVRGSNAAAAAAAAAAASPAASPASVVSSAPASPAAVAPADASPLAASPPATPATPPPATPQPLLQPAVSSGAAVAAALAAAAPPAPALAPVVAPAASSSSSSSSSSSGWSKIRSLVARPVRGSSTAAPGVSPPAK